MNMRFSDGVSSTVLIQWEKPVGVAAPVATSVAIVWQTVWHDTKRGYPSGTLTH